MAQFEPANTLLQVCEVLGCQATAIEPIERARVLMAELVRLRAETAEYRRRLGEESPPGTPRR